MPDAHRPVTRPTFSVAACRTGAGEALRVRGQDRHPDLGTRLPPGAGRVRPERSQPGQCVEVLLGGFGRVGCQGGLGQSDAGQCRPWGRGGGHVAAPQRRAGQRPGCQRRVVATLDHFWPPDGRG